MRRLNASFLCLLAFILSASAAPNLFSVSPYVQHPATNAMSILFFTTENVKATVKVWPADGSESAAIVKTTTPTDVSSILGKNPKNSDTLTYTKQYKHAVRFTDLKLHADYCYSVTPEGGATYGNMFRTLPDRNTPVRFIGYCDCETTPNGAATDWSNHASEYGIKNVSKYFVGLTEGFASNLVHIAREKPDLITISGDIAAKGGYQKNWDEFWRQNAGVNAKGDGYGDIAGSIPILAAIGNHDLKDGSSTVDSELGGEFALEKYLTYFEYNSNGVEYACSDGTTTPEMRDMSQLFHRTDLGPVTLIFLDTNKGAKGKNKDSTQDYADRPTMRAPDFHPGSLQYTWLTNNLADAQRNSKFTFVINHHCPYSVGQHNRPSDGGGYDGYNTGSGCDGESAQAVRCLTETMIQYGVDAWLCGHDEIQEHSQLTGTEILPNGKTRTHTLNIYDLGSGGDGLRGTKYVENPYEVFRAFADSGEKWENDILVEGGCHYGFMEVDVTTNQLGKWTCSLTPCYDFINQVGGKAAGFELRRYQDRVIIDQASNEIVYQETKNAPIGTDVPADYVEYARPPEGPGDASLSDDPEEPDGPPAVASDSFAVKPYLQRPASDAMSILFFTKAASVATVTCKRHDGVGETFTKKTTGIWAEALTNNLACTDSKSDRSRANDKLYRHNVRFMGLKPNRIYDYTVTLVGGTSYTSTFRTAPDRNTPIRFVAYADCETESDPWANYVANLAQMKSRNPDFIAIPGDFVARGGIQSYWDGFWKANAGDKGTIASSIPLLTVLGNHDLYDNGVKGDTASQYKYDLQGETGTERYLAYFENEPNGVTYEKRDGTNIPETRDLSQLFHRVDYGPVTLIFLDTNNGDDNDPNKDTNYETRTGNYCPPGIDRHKGGRHPDFNPGTPQYTWLTNNLADAQQKSRFTFVFNHHCPYSIGSHNKGPTETGGSAQPVRILTETMVRYGVDGWICGHDEILEHSITNGYEILPDGQRRKHTLSIYDLGCSGDTFRQSDECVNPLEYFKVTTSNYGFLEIDVNTNKSGRWTCSLTPVNVASGSYVAQADQTILVEDPDRDEGMNDLVYAQATNAKNPIDGASQTKPFDWVAWTKPPEGLAWDESVEVSLTEVTAADLTYNGAVQTPRLTVKAGELIVPSDYYTVSVSPTPVKDAGEYEVTVTGKANVKGSKIVKFTIKPAPATIKAKDITMVVGTIPEPALEVDISGTFGNDTVAYKSLSRKSGSGIGTYAITVTGVREQGNYDVTFVNGTFTIKEETIFEPGQDAVITVSGPTAVDVGATAISVKKVTIKGTGDLTIRNYQNLTPSSVDLSGLSGTVTYMYVSDAANKSSGLQSKITSETDQKVKYGFAGTTAGNGWNIGSWTSSTTLKTHLVLESGTHSITWGGNSATAHFAQNGTDENPTVLVRNGATLNFTAHDLSGYQGSFVAGGVIRVNAGGTLNFIENTSGTYHNFNYRQRLVLDPESLTTIKFRSSYLFTLHGAGATPGEAATETTANIYVPASDGTKGPAVLMRAADGATGLCINHTGDSRGGGCAVFVGENSKLRIDASVQKGEENDSSSNKRILAKLGPGELEITGEVTSSVDFDARAGIITLSSGQGKFNKSLTATALVTYRFPSGWASDMAYTLGSGTVTGTAPAANAATVYVGEEKLTGVTLTYSGKTVSYSKPREPQPIVSATAEDAVYNGQVQYPVLVVKARDGSIVPDDAYEVIGWTPSELKKPGQYTATVRGTTAQYTGEVAVSFTILSGPPAEFSVTPYLQHPAPTEMTILFFTRQRCAATVSCAGRTFNADCEQATELVKIASDDQTIWGTQYRHRARLTGLTPDTTYPYMVALEDGETYANEFRTAPADINTPVRFVAYSDSETIPPDYKDSTGNNKATADGRTEQWDVLVNGQNEERTYHVSRSVGFASNLLHMAAWKPDFYVIAGDLVARGGVQLFWDEFWKENAGGLGRGYGDPAGAAPILAVMGNHDHYDNKNTAALNYNTSSDEIGLKKYLTYFEYEPNGVDYANSSTERDARDKSQLFHRLDYGPVTILFLDTNRGGSSNSGSRVPSFDKGSLQYLWIENNLKDARDVRHSRFIFVVSHQDPYSCGKHNKPDDGQSTKNVRDQLTDLMHKYGVTGWFAGHDEMQEHAQVTGTETFADGSTHPHKMNVYDLGSAGDGLKGEREFEDNAQYIVYSAYHDSPDGTHYGHLQVEVAPSNGVWYCTMVPAYSYFKDATSPSELRRYKDRIVIREGGEHVYQEWAEIPRDRSEAVTIQQGKSYTFTTIASSSAWNVKSANTGYVTASGVRNADGTCTVTINCLYSYQDPIKVEVRSGSSTAGSGTLLKTVTVTAAPEERTINLNVGETVTLSSSYSSSRYWIAGGEGANAGFARVGVTLGSGTRSYTKKTGYSIESANKTTSVKLAVTGKSVGQETVRLARLDSDSGDPKEALVLHVTVKPYPVVIKPTKTSRQYGAIDPTIGYVIEPATLPDGTKVVLSGALGRVSGEAIGFYDITLGTFADAALNPNYTITLDETAAQDAFEITRIPVTVKADDVSKEYGTADPSLTATVRGTNGVDGISFKLKRATGESYGDYTITVTGDAEQGPYAITYVPGTFHITKTLPEPSKTDPLTAELTYGETIGMITKVGGKMLDHSGKEVTGAFVFAESSMMPSVVESGQEFAAVFNPQDTANFDSAPVKVKVTVHPRTLTVRPTDISIVYGDAPPSYGYGLSGFISGEDNDKAHVSGSCGYDCTYKQGDDAKTYDIELTSIELTAPNYVFVKSATPGKLTVMPKPVTVTANNASKTYGDPDPTFTVKVTDANGKELAGNLVTYDPPSRTAGEDAKEYTIIVTGDSNQGNYSVTFKNGSLTINQAEIMSAAAESMPWTGSTISPAIAVYSGDTLLTADRDYTVSSWKKNGVSATLRDIGNYTATVTGKGNYKGAKTVMFSIVKADYDMSGVSFEGKQVTYDGQFHSLEIGGTLPDGVTVSYSAGGTDVGDYEITATFAGDKNHHEIPPKAAKLTITPAPATVKALDAKKVYGATDPDFEAKVDGVFQGGTLTYGFVRAEGEKVGAYTITPTGEELQGNYRVTYQSGTLTIDKAPLTVSPVAAVIRYRDPAPAFGRTFATFVRGDDESVVSGACTFRCDYRQGDAPGYYGIYVDDISAFSAENYTFVADPSPAMLLVLSVEESAILNTFEQIAEIRPTDFGWEIALMNDIEGPLEILDNLGEVVFDVKGHEVWGCDAAGGADGEPAIRIVSAKGAGSTARGRATRLVLCDSSEAHCGLVRGGKGGDPSGRGGAGVSVLTNVLFGVSVDVDDTIEDRVSGGDGGDPDGLPGLAVDNPMAESEVFIDTKNADEGVNEGDSIVILVTGGSYERSTSVQLQAVYGTAAASDLDLGNVMVNGAKDAAFKFPYTLTWKAGDVREQMIEIPVKEPSKAKQTRDLMFELQNPQNLKLKGVDGKTKNKSQRKVKIIGKGGAVANKFYICATPNDATRGKTSGSALVAEGKNVTLKATANKGYVFVGWYLGDECKERAAKYVFEVEDSVDLIARFVPLDEDYLKLTADFLPAEIKLGTYFAREVSVASLSLPTITVSGLPAGLRYDKTANVIYGTPTKAATAKVKVTVKNLGGYKIVRTYEVKVVSNPQTTAAKVLSDDKPYAAVTAKLSDDAAGKVTGAGLYQAGKKVTVKATANKGYVFAGWEGLEGLGGLDLTKASMSFVMPSDKVSLVAKFVLPGEIPDPTGKGVGVAVVRNNDFAGTVTGAGYYQAGKKVTLKATANKGYVFSGWATDDFTVTNQAASLTFTMGVANVRYYAVFVTAGEDFSSIATAMNGVSLARTEMSLATDVMCGVDLRWPVVAEALSLPTVKVSGLPSGLKFTAKDIMKKGSKTEVDIPANTIYGAPTAASKMDKPSKVKIAVTTSGKSKREYQIALTVDALPDYAVGTFDGPVFAADGTTNGIITLTVKANGQISGTIQTNIAQAAAKKLALKAASFAALANGVFYLAPTYTENKVAIEVPMTLADSGAKVNQKQIGVIRGDVGGNNFVAYLNVLKGFEAGVFLAPDLTAKYPNLTLTAKKGGILTIAGKVGDIKVSGSSQIYRDVLEEELVFRAVIYVPSKKGFDGVAEVVAVEF